jgi:hypothetical protein
MQDFAVVMRLLLPVLAAALALALPAAASAQAPDAAGTVWLCRPGQTPNPCRSSLTTTVVEPDGSTHVQREHPAERPPIDCFYVYPTVSAQPGTNADLTIDPAEIAVARAQASRFSTTCRVFAPMYPQITLNGIRASGGITAEAGVKAYLGVLSAFRDYLANDNHGRGFVLIGHSQGASLLNPLMRMVVDPDPALRRRLVSALLFGDQVTVPVGANVGASFGNIPACRSTRQTGCVVSYSTFDTQPPPNSLFGRVGTGLSPIRPPDIGRPQHILCVNPAAPAGGAGLLLPYFRATGATRTPWVSYPREYSGRCKSADDATWLQVDDIRRPGDKRPVIAPTQGPLWGLHNYDVNVALGNLTALVADQAAAYRRK